MKTVIKMW